MNKLGARIRGCPLWPALAIAALLALFVLAGCSDSDDDEGDTGDDATGDDDQGSEPECEEGALRCTADANLLLECAGGVWTLRTDCRTEQGRLCENNACVDPWRYGSPVFSKCENHPYATEQSLAQKAAHYDALARRLHAHPLHQRLITVTLREGVFEDEAGWEDVERWHTGENDGLWTGAYIASQGFRYAVTGDPEALETIRFFLEGMVRGTRITGIPGLHTREFRIPSIPGMECPADPNQYIPDVEKDDNKWVHVDQDGTVLVYDGAQWVRTSHRVPEEFGGTCWLDNISKDEYSGHLLALGVLYKLVDDASVRQTVSMLLTEVADHLIDNDMQFVDWDGRVTEHGRVYPMAFDDFPGFNAALGLSWMRMGVEASGRQDIQDYYDFCLLQRGDAIDCLHHPFQPPLAFPRYMDFMGLYLGPTGCKNNWNNFNMTFMAVFNLIWYEIDPYLRPYFQEVLERQMIQYNDNDRDMLKQSNSFFNFIFAAMKKHGPGTTGPAYSTVEDAVCALREFPASKAVPTIHSGEDQYPTDWTCESRFAGSYLTFDPLPIRDRCPGIFIWTRNPYRHSHCDENSRRINAPADYLLAYWMGRYFGFIDQDL